MGHAAIHGDFGNNWARTLELVRERYPRVDLGDVARLGRSYDELVDHLVQRGAGARPDVARDVADLVRRSADRAELHPPGSVFRDRPRGARSRTHAPERDGT